MSRLPLLAGLVAAALLPGEPLGIAVPLVAALVGAAAVRAVRPPRPRALLGLLALALAAMAAVRDATWLVSLDLTAAWIVGAVAVGAGGIAAPLAPLVRLLSTRPRTAVAPTRGAPAARGLVLGSLVCVPFALLFLSADAAFAELARTLPLPSAASTLGRALTFVLVALAAVGLALGARRPLAIGPLRPWWPRPVSLLEWILPLALLNALFALFVGVQVAVLFGGHDHVLRTAGLTYAQYAREGFWQLLVAAALTLVVVVAGAAVVRPDTRGARLAFRAGVALLVALTLVVLASALRRLWLYEDAFGLTRARVSAEAVLLWVGVLLLLALAATLVPRVRRVAPASALAATAVGLLAFSAANPDARIAASAVERHAAGEEIDVEYVAGLSADAAPELARLPRPLAVRVLHRTRARVAGDEAPGSWNLSRARARDALARVRA